MLNPSEDKSIWGHDRLDLGDRAPQSTMERGSGDIARQSWDNSSNSIWSQYSNLDTASLHLPGLILDDSAPGASHSADSNLTKASDKGVSGSASSDTRTAADTSGGAHSASTDTGSKMGSDNSTASGAASDHFGSHLLASLQQDFRTLLADEKQIGK